MASIKELFKLTYPLIIAHRGARAHAPENTLLAAKLAHASGAEMWELDVNLTQDYHLVVMHDDTLTRTTNVQQVFPERKSYRVCDFTLAELKTLDAGSWYLATDPFGELAAKTVTLGAEFPGLTVPTLAEALQLTKDLDWTVNVEIKNHAHLIGHTTVTKAVLDLISSLDMVDQVLLSSFQHVYLQEAHKICKGLATAALLEGDVPADPIALCQQVGVEIYHPDRKILSLEDLMRLRRAGIRVNVWTVNDLEQAKSLMQGKASGIITDYPAACMTLRQDLINL